jgi:hypothetical protein
MMKPVTAMILTLAALLLVGCGQGEKGDKGDPGPAGPAGPKGDPGATGPKADARFVVVRGMEKVPCPAGTTAVIATCSDGTVGAIDRSGAFADCLKGNTGVLICQTSN